MMTAVNMSSWCMMLRCYVNVADHPANVAYQEVDLPADFVDKFHHYVPNVYLNSPEADIHIFRSDVHDSAASNAWDADYCYWCSWYRSVCHTAEIGSCACSVCRVPYFSFSLVFSAVPLVFLVFVSDASCLTTVSVLSLAPLKLTLLLAVWPARGDVSYLDTILLCLWPFYQLLHVTL